MSTDVVTLERHIAARPATVFSFFTERDKWLAWMGKDGEFTFEPGGAYRTNVRGDNVAEGRFVEIDPPRRLVFTWGWAEGGMAVPPGSSTVEITLEPLGEGTVLRLAHHGLPSPEACSAHAEGWTHYLRRLVVWAEGGDPGPDDWM
ncbi:SRPBCC domain-containing protein [Streptomyces sp. APSN-46.1]|uniref:SRPBCC family protein n=1 Tax=Streptomyces sp. APSN-46.1 TaxID=2929049 RepID=UPI001FB35441|nr:SRPBCC domain-containing protein [Streptomyces sp. APSN-46.1]MCJ1676069.1 SRPBCC domain-containing protein [Streptomyces sp. APSN-46.1]